MNSSFYQKAPSNLGDLRENIQKYTKYWYVFILTFALCILGAFIYLQTINPRYKVSSTLLVQDDQKGQGEVKESAFSDLNMFRSDRKADNEMEVLRSRDLIYKTLKDLSLETGYFVKGSLKDEELYGKNLPIKVTLLSVNASGYLKRPEVSAYNDHQYVLKDKDQKWILPYDKTVQKPGYQIIVSKGPAFQNFTDPVELKFKNLQRMAESYSLTGLVVLPVVKDANTIVISLTDNVPQRGLDILNVLIKKYNEEDVLRKNLIAVNTINFIDKRLHALNKDLTGVEHDVENYKQDNMVTDVNTDAQMNVAKSGEYGQMLSNTNSQLNVVSSLEKYLQNSSLNVVPSALNINNATLADLTAKYNATQQERAKMLRTSEESNPLVQNLTAQLVSLKSNIQENLQNIKKGLQIERNSQQAMSSRFNSKVRSVPAVERGLLERTREQSVKSGLYRYLLQKREETTLSLSATVPTSQTIDKPAYNSVPVSPKTELIYLCASFAGLLIPGAFIYGRSLLNNKIRDIKDIELLTGVPVLGVLNHVNKNEAALIDHNSRSTITELFRYIRSNLNFMNNGLPDQVMLVTSCMKSEGKTFFSVNLGLTLASVNKRVVLLEFDMREPQLLQRLHLDSKIGITDYLLNPDVTIDELLSNSRKYHDLIVVDCGPITTNPSELMMHPKIGKLIEELKRRFDYVIIDTAPVGQVADAFSLSAYTDLSIYLIRYNYTDKLQLNILKDILYYKKLTNPMVVFNDAKVEPSNTYGYGGFGYGYGFEVSKN
ncbi:GumC family protein [Pedobacter gandavensis]|uniref:non-specific protein-tyrosine kinase n=1 Tax=Pedobacter gandavensis TaxID=2679963 RepID=A0ABR6EVH0_9SPHI|nr:polysaccharide biosynthesis tyrosine autokinase [Pedobacter gandavensis]MBB2148453.1 polysaccharide biosynthesis tyrosine autokinase [Pedobacter gandavensis]